MKLLSDLYNISKSINTVDGFDTIITLNEQHIIYTAHFPGHPVTPGVVQLQIVHELLENHLKEKIKLLEMSRCKFQKSAEP